MSEELEPKKSKGKGMVVALFIFIVVFLLIIGAAAGFAIIYDSQKGDGDLELTISMTGNATIGIVLKNVDTHEIRVDSYHQWKNWCSIRDENGSRPSFVGDEDGYRPPQHSDLVVLSPGDTITASLSLDYNFDLVPGRTYTVSVTYKAVAEQELFLAYWKGEIDSNEVTFTV